MDTGVAVSKLRVAHSPGLPACQALTTEKETLFCALQTLTAPPHSTRVGLFVHMYVEVRGQLVGIYCLLSCMISGTKLRSSALGAGACTYQA